MGAAEMRSTARPGLLELQLRRSLSCDSALTMMRAVSAAAARVRRSWASSRRHAAVRSAAERPSLASASSSRSIAICTEKLPWSDQYKCSRGVTWVSLQCFA